MTDLPAPASSATTAAAPVCRVCRSARHRFLCATPNTHSQTTPLHHHRCLECGSVFVADAIGPAELGVAYSTLDSTTYYADIETETTDKMVSAIADLSALQLHKQRLIDVGTGNGMFVPLLAKAGFSDISVHEIEGNDLSQIAGQVRAMYQDYDYATVPSDAFDVVTLLDVAEHVIEPLFLMKTSHRILRDGGTLYIHTPVVTRTDRAMHALLKLPGLARIGRMWQAGRTSIFHLQNYTPRALDDLLRQAGFDDVKIIVRNELSWPVSRYIQAFVLQRLGLPFSLAPLLVPFFYPLLASKLFNANKAIVTARKRPRPA
ncbi:MAG: class I SAM-dependent methyltransferase [Caldimonas sp.]